MPFGGLLTVGLIGAGGSLLGGLFGSSAASKAAKQQTAAQQQGLDFQKQVWGQEQANQAPFIQAGTASIGQLMDAIKNGTFGPGSNAPVPQFTGTFTAPTADEARATPGYQFTAEQGSKGVLQGAAAAGGAITGGTLKALDQYNTGLADTTYNDVFNRALQTYGTQLSGYQANLAGYGMGLQKQGQEFNQLLQPAALGEGSVQALNNTGQQVSNNVGNIMSNIGNSQAAGTVGSANAWSNAFGGAANSTAQALTLAQLMKMFSGGGTGGYAPNIGAPLGPTPMPIGVSP